MLRIVKRRAASVGWGCVLYEALPTMRGRLRASCQCGMVGLGRIQAALLFVRSGAGAGASDHAAQKQGAPTANDGEGGE